MKYRTFYFFFNKKAKHVLPIWISRDFWACTCMSCSVYTDATMASVSVSFMKWLFPGNWPCSWDLSVAGSTGAGCWSVDLWPLELLPPESWPAPCWQIVHPWSGIWMWKHSQYHTCMHQTVLLLTPGFQCLLLTGLTPGEFNVPITQVHHSTYADHIKWIEFSFTGKLCLSLTKVCKEWFTAQNTRVNTQNMLNW